MVKKTRTTKVKAERPTKAAASSSGVKLPVEIADGTDTLVTPNSISSEDVQLAFRYIFGKEARQEDIDFHIKHQSMDDLRNFFFASEGFFNSLDRRLLYPEPWIAVDSKKGFLIWVCMQDLYVSTGAMQGQWEPDTTAFCESQLATGSVFFDAGAMIGWFTLLAAKIVGSAGKVYSFEPHQETYNYLRSSISINRFEDRVSLYPLALSDIESKVQLLRESGAKDGRVNAGNTWIGDSVDTSQNELDVGMASAVRMDSIKFDRRIDLMKVDIEGAEWKMFNGAENTIRTHRPMIVCEMFPEQLLKVSGVSGQELIDKIESWGYSSYLLLPDGSTAPWREVDLPKGTKKLNTIVFK